MEELCRVLVFEPLAGSIGLSQYWSLRGRTFLELVFIIITCSLLIACAHTLTHTHMFSLSRSLFQLSLVWLVYRATIAFLSLSPARAVGSGDSGTRFTGANAISSDQYFGRDQSTHDPEAQARLQTFEGAGAISSAQFFGRDETTMGADDDDIASQIAATASSDLQQLGAAVSVGMDKLAELATDFFSDW